MTESEEQQRLAKDCWTIEGDYLVRKHRLPRTTLFSPLDVPDDPPPIAAENIEVLRITKADILWDALAGHGHNRRLLDGPCPRREAFNQPTQRRNADVDGRDSLRACTA